MADYFQAITSIGGDRLDRKNLVRRGKLSIQIDFFAIDLCRQRLFKYITVKRLQRIRNRRGRRDSALILTVFYV